MAERVLVTAALPYANGSIHLGHMLEAVQTDVYVRARRMMGDDVVFMWADDTHGTPIQVRATKEGITPQALIDRAYAEHVADYRDFDIGFDIFHTTHSPENEKHAGAIFSKMKARGDIVARDVEQLYDPKAEMFLPDRLVKGTCPNCKTPDQYGDVCESCGKTYAPTDLLDPYSTVSGETPVLRTSEHLFVLLGRHEEFLRDWLRSREEGGGTALQSSVRNQLMPWVEDGLQDWDISREPPYFGIEIPGYPGKFFYVWFDAPVGYIAATDKFCQDNGRDFDAYWHATRDDTEIVHVIGKDIVYFHCLFWPAMLNAAGYTVPSRVQVHGWLQVNGSKMSKSKGTFVLARTYLDHLPPDYLRYYLAAKLSGSQDDFDLNFEDFTNRVNADLVNKAANLASRCIKFLVGRLDGKVAPLTEDGEALMGAARDKFAGIPDLFREFEFAKALRLAMEIAEACNVYVTEREPWKLGKSDPAGAAAILSAGVQVTKLVAAALKPVLPKWGAAVERMLGLDAPLTFANAAEPVPVGTELGAYENLAERLDPKKLEAIVEASKEDMQSAEEKAADAVEAPFEYEVEALADEVSIDDFLPLDLRVGVVEACEKVEGSKKLLRLTIDLGPLGSRTIFSGIALSYAPASLVGKRVVVFANLKPRKMRFGVSEGMVLASGASDDAVTVLELADTARPGEKIT